jgi:hypothetical protein
MVGVGQLDVTTSARNAVVGRGAADESARGAAAKAEVHNRQGDWAE